MEKFNKEIEAISKRIKKLNDYTLKQPQLMAYLDKEFRYDVNTNEDYLEHIFQALMNNVYFNLGE